MQAALQLSQEQRDAQVANTASMLGKFITACRVHREVLQEPDAAAASPHPGSPSLSMARCDGAPADPVLQCGA